MISLIANWNTPGMIRAMRTAIPTIGAYKFHLYIGRKCQCSAKQLQVNLMSHWVTSLTPYITAMVTHKHAHHIHQPDLNHSSVWPVYKMMLQWQQISQSVELSTVVTTVHASSTWWKRAELDFLFLLTSIPGSLVQGILSCTNLNNNHLMSWKPQENLFLDGNYASFEGLQWMQGEEN